MTVMIEFNMVSSVRLEHGTDMLTASVVRAVRCDTSLDDMALECTGFAVVRKDHCYRHGLVDCSLVHKIDWGETRTGSFDDAAGRFHCFVYCLGRFWLSVASAYNWSYPLGQWLPAS